MQRSSSNMFSHRLSRSAFLGLLLLGVSVIYAGVGVRDVSAQLGDGIQGIYQRHELVGLVWVPPKSDRCNYVEHWYLAPDYVYPNSPGAGMFIDTTLKSAALSLQFEDAAEFYGYARELLPGGKRVVVFAAELDHCGESEAGEAFNR